MKNLTKILFGVNLILALFLLIEIHGWKKEDPQKRRTSSSTGIVNKAQILGPDGRSDVFCAILLIPKSLLPVVKQMSRHKIARGIKLLPANMEWDRGNLVARSKDSYSINRYIQPIQNKHVFSKVKKASDETPAEVKNRLRAATLLAYFLADETKTKFWQQSTRY